LRWTWHSPAIVAVYLNLSWNGGANSEEAGAPIRMFPDEEAFGPPIARGIDQAFQKFA
jgi:hypothetical protein